MKIRVLYTVGMLMLVSAVSAVNAMEAEKEYTTVEVQELAAYPYKYWAQGIVFNDVMSERQKPRKHRHEGILYISVQMETVGDCFIPAPVYDQMISKWKPGREYVISGTVLQTEGGLFKKERYLILCEGIGEVIREEGFTVTAEAGRAGSQNRVQFQTLLSRVFKNLSSMAASKGNDLSTLVHPDYEQRDEILSAIEKDIGVWTEEIELSAARVLATLLLNNMADELNRAAASTRQGSSESPAVTNVDELVENSPPEQELDEKTRRALQKEQKKRAREEERRKKSEAKALKELQLEEARRKALETEDPPRETGDENADAPVAH